MKAEEVMRGCAFAPGRACTVELDEVPLEVCRLCLEVWRTSRENISVKPSVKRLKAAVETSEAPGTVQVKPLNVRAVESTAPVNGQLSLSELDKLLWEGKIEMDQYLKRRKEIVNSLSRETSPFSSFEEALENLGVGSEAESVAVFVVEGGKVRAEHPEGAVLPEGLDGARGALEAMQELYGALNRHGTDAHLEVGWKRITCLGCSGKRLAILVSDSKLRLEHFEGGIREARNMLRKREDWEEILPLLHSVIVGEAGPAVAES